MIAVVVGAILLTVAIPNFTELIRTNQTVSQTNKITRDLNFARSEAVRRGTSVTMCRSTTGAGCTGGNWEQGWIVFTDINGNGALDGADVRLQVNEGLDTNFTLRTGAAFANGVTYAANGNASGVDIFRVCRPDGDVALSRAVRVNITGRIRVSAGVGCP